MQNPFIYTDRYISKYWITIINEYLIFLNKKYNINIKNDQDQDQDQSNKLNKEINTNKLNKFNKLNKLNKLNKIIIQNNDYNDSLTNKIKILLNSIDKYIIKSSKNKQGLLIYSYYYNDIKNNIIIIPLKKTEYYNTLNYYFKDLSYNNNKCNLLIKYKNNKFLSLNIQNMPNINIINGFNYSNTELLETNNINNADNKIISKNDYLQVNNKFKQNFDEIISSCYFADNLHYLKNSSNSFKTQTDCINIGGLWDKPCKKNNDCHYNKCDYNTGYCINPRGVKSIGYTFNDNSPPLCHKDTLIYKCKKNDKNYKWDLNGI